MMMDYLMEFQTRADFEARLAHIERRLEEIEHDLLRRRLGAATMLPDRCVEDATPAKGGNR